VRRYRVTVDGRTYDVEVDDPRARPVTARVAGEVFRIDVQDSGQFSGDSSQPIGTMNPAPSPAVPGQHLLTAPIPGTITKIVATVGQSVQRGDPLLTIEAMKMFNVIRSPWAGTVATVHVTEGEHVTQGKLMLSFLQA
jgi:glutaconyl-CoA decarboxylase